MLILPIQGHKMKQLTIAFLLLSLSPQGLLANVCVVNQEDGGTVTILNNGRRSLYDQGQPLENHPVQDQDGLGICYANATSTVLKSVLPGHPDISYTDVAVQTTALRPLGAGYNQFADQTTNNHSFVEGGSVCEAINSLRRSGGACPQRFSITETPSAARDPNVQGRIFLGLGRYLDRPQFFAASDLEEFRLMVAPFRELLAQTQQTCRETIARPFPLSEAIGRILQRAAIENPTSGENCKRAILAAIGRSITPTSIIRGDRANITPNPEVIARVEQLINADPALTRVFRDHAASPTLNTDWSIQTELRLINLWDRLLNSIIPSEQLAPTCPSRPNESPLPVSHTYASEFVQIVRRNKQMNCDALAPGGQHFNVADFRSRVQQDPRISCLALSRQEDILNAVMPLLEVGYHLENLSTPAASSRAGSIRSADIITDLLMPQCRNPVNRLTLNNISCSEEYFCRSRTGLRRLIGGQGQECLSPEASRDLLRRKITSGIRAARALGISVCAAFLSNPELNTNHCNNPNSGDGALHAMAVVGYKCEAGQIKYQVLNSWGRSCPIASGSMQSGGIECEVVNGRATGKIWVTEDSLAENSIRVTEVRRP
jgi:hypothetical protein